MTEFRKDALEVGAELLGTRLGKTLAEVLPTTMKDGLLNLLGGADGTISEQQIAVFSILPKFVLKGTMSEEGAQSFVRSFAQEMREYGLNPSPDKAQRRKDLERIFTTSLKSTEIKSDAIEKPMRFFEAVAACDERQRRYLIALFAEMRDKKVVYPMADGSTELAYEYLLSHGQKRFVSQEWFTMALTSLSLNAPIDSILYLRNAVDYGELIPGPKPKEPTIIDDIEAFAKDRLKDLKQSLQTPPNPTAPLTGIFAAMDAKADTWKRARGK